MPLMRGWKTAVAVPGRTAQSGSQPDTWSDGPYVGGRAGCFKVGSLIGLPGNGALRGYVGVGA